MQKQSFTLTFTPSANLSFGGEPVTMVLNIEASHDDTKLSTWVNSSYCPHYSVMVTSSPSAAPTSLSFDFWGSIADGERGTHPLPVEMLNAAVSDALCYLDISGDDEMEKLDNFAEEFGYEKISDAIKAFSGCRTAYRNALNLFGTDEVLYFVADALREWEDEETDAAGPVVDSE